MNLKSSISLSKKHSLSNNNVLSTILELSQPVIICTVRCISTNLSQSKRKYEYYSFPYEKRLSE